MRENIQDHIKGMFAVCMYIYVCMWYMCMYVYVCTYIYTCIKLGENEGKKKIILKVYYIVFFHTYAFSGWSIFYIWKIVLVCVV
jgi:hypothetical protein